MPSPAKILIVDDDPDIRDSLGEALREEGYEVTQFSGAREALDYLRGGARIDVILLDLFMPGLDGLALDLDPAAVRFNQLARDVQPEPEATVLAHRNGSLEPFEHRRDLVLRDADSPVGDHQPHRRVVSLEGELDRLSRAELHCI